MEVCELCDAEVDMMVDSHGYCAKHFVDKDDAECLYWSFHALMQGNFRGRSVQSSKIILDEIKKKHPEFLKKYEKQRLDEAVDIMNALSEMNLRHLADLMGVGLNEPFGPPLDKEEIILVLSTEPVENVETGLKKLRSEWELDLGQLKNDLIQIYEEYLEDPENETMKEKARKLHNRFMNATTFLDKSTAYAINLLVDVGWDLPAPPKPSEETVKELLQTLRASGV